MAARMPLTDLPGGLCRDLQREVRSFDIGRANFDGSRRALSQRTELPGSCRKLPALEQGERDVMRV